MVTAEKNTNPSANGNAQNVCGDPALPATEELRGITPLIDPAVDVDGAVAALSKSSAAAPLDATGLSVFDLLDQAGLGDLVVAQNGAGGAAAGGAAGGAAKGGAAGGAAAGGAAAGGAAAGGAAAGGAAKGAAGGAAAAGGNNSTQAATGNNNANGNAKGKGKGNGATQNANGAAAGNNQAAAGNNQAAAGNNNANGNAKGKGNGANANGAAQNANQAAAGNNNANANGNAKGKGNGAAQNANGAAANNGQAAAGNNNNDQSAAGNNQAAAGNAAGGAAAGGAATAAGGEDFGDCTPTIIFEGGQNGRPATEFTFQIADATARGGQGEALNPNIITKALCNQLTNVCNANAAAVTTCQAAAAKVEAAGTRDKSTADLFNSAIGFAGAVTNPDGGPADVAAKAAGAARMMRRGLRL
jgi:hypothetical protein